MLSDSFYSTTNSDASESSVLRWFIQSVNIWWSGSSKHDVIACFISTLFWETMIMESSIVSISCEKESDLTRILWHALSFRKLYNCIGYWIHRNKFYISFFFVLVNMNLEKKYLDRCFQREIILKANYWGRFPNLFVFWFPSFSFSKNAPNVDTNNY